MSAKGEFDRHAIALSAAVDARDLEAVDALMSAGADVNGRGPHGARPLLSACANGHLDVAAHLLARGADPRVQDDGGGTALLALLEGTSRARFLPDVVALQAQAHRSIDRFRPIVREVVAMGAAQSGDLDHELVPPEGFDEILEALLEGGVRIDAVDDLGRSALAIAVCEGYPARVVKALLDHGGDPFQQDEDGLCAADFARSHPSPPVHAMLDASN